LLKKIVTNLKILKQLTNNAKNVFFLSFFSFNSRLFNLVGSWQSDVNVFFVICYGLPREGYET